MNILQFMGVTIVTDWACGLFLPCHPSHEVRCSSKNPYLRTSITGVVKRIHRRSGVVWTRRIGIGHSKKYEIAVQLFWILFLVTSASFYVCRHHTRPYMNMPMRVHRRHQIRLVESQSELHFSSRLRHASSKPSLHNKRV